MNPLTHLMVGWSVAELTPLARRDRAFVGWAALLPDFDGAGILVDFATGTPPSVGLYGQYHHVLGHNVAVAALASGLAWFFAERRALCAFLVCVSFHLHLLGDLVGSAGPEGSIWTLAYLVPFDDRTFGWAGQWELNAWPNLAISAVLLAWLVVLGVRRGRTPVELVSLRADARVVEALRARFARSR